MENEWRDRLVEMIEADGRSKRALSMLTGYGENYVQQLLKDKKEPSFPRLAKLLSVLGSRATAYVISGILQDEVAQLRSSLIAYGLDKDDLDPVLTTIQGFKQARAGARSRSSQLDDRSEPANRRRESTPSE